VCDGTLLPHCEHLFSSGACQRWVALRVRNRIFEVLRLGTPMASRHESMPLPEGNFLTPPPNLDPNPTPSERQAKNRIRIMSKSKKINAALIYPARPNRARAFPLQRGRPKRHQFPL
jgi:hypothetical protein